MHLTEDITAKKGLLQPPGNFPFSFLPDTHIRRERDLGRGGLEWRSEKPHQILSILLSKFLRPSLTQTERDMRVRLEMRLKISIGLKWTLYSLNVLGKQSNVPRLTSKGLMLAGLK